MTSFLQTAIDAVSLGSLYAVLAIGIALIFGIMNLMNFAYGELLTVGAYTLLVLSPFGWVTQVVGCLAVAVLASMAMDKLAFRPFRGASGPVLLVTSFALSFALQALAIVLFGSRARGIDLPTWFSTALDVGPLTFSSLNLITVGAGVVLIGGLALFLRFSMLGISMRAAAENFTVARLVGVKSGRVLSAAFAVSGLTAGVCAILLVAQVGTVTPRFGTNAVLVAFVATIIGGLGSLYGAAVAGLILGVVTVVLQVALPESVVGFRDAFLYCGVLLILLLRPNGLIVVRSRMERV